MTGQRIRKLKLQLQNARHRLVTMQSNFAAPLYDMKYVATQEVQRISTNGACIYFDPDWLQKLDPAALDFMLAHQLMHIVLGHIDRPLYLKGDRFHLACDVVANSNLWELGWKYDRLPHVGRIYYETFYPTIRGSELTAQEAVAYVPLDPASMSPGVRRSYMIDSEEWWDRPLDRGEGATVVLSPMDDDPDDLSIDTTAGGDHRVFEKESFYPSGGEERRAVNDAQTGLDWDKLAASELNSLRSANREKVDPVDADAFRERIWQKPNTPTLGWRKILNIFVQAEICDYTFTPPDRRLQEPDFFLPDFNLTVDRPKEVLFMVDTSASIDEDVLSCVYSELRSALEQFGGGLIGLLGFFDRRVYRPVMFSSIGALRTIIPIGGGGTDYHCIFQYVRNNMDTETLASIVIFTDGEAAFPDESAADTVPVLWLLSNRQARVPWGKVAYFV